MKQLLFALIVHKETTNSGTLEIQLERPDLGSRPLDSPLHISPTGATAFPLFHLYFFALLQPLIPFGIREHDRARDGAVARGRGETERCVDLASRSAPEIAHIDFPQTQDEAGDECVGRYKLHRPN